jgi:hypothetical protein
VGQWRHGIGDGAYVVDGITVLCRGRWRCVKRLNRGRERWCGGSGEDSTMTRRLQGGLNDGMGSGEVNDDVDSREIFDRKFWQPDDVSESL